MEIPPTLALVFKATTEGDVGTLAALLRNDPNLCTRLDHTNTDGHTALAIAAKMGNRDTASLLVRSGASPYVGVLKAANTPLHFAAMEGHAEVLEAMLTSALSTSQPPPARPTAAARPVDTPNDGGDTALMFACASARLPAVKTLLSHSANPGHQNATGMSPLMCVAGHHDAASPEAPAQSPAAVVHLLADSAQRIIGIDGGKLIQAQDKRGNTALHFACASGQAAVAKALLEVDAKEGSGNPGQLLWMKNKRGSTAFDEASQGGRSAGGAPLGANHPECIKLLREREQLLKEQSEARLRELLDEEDTQTISAKPKRNKKSKKQKARSSGPAGSTSSREAPPAPPSNVTPDAPDPDPDGPVPGPQAQTNQKDNRSSAAATRAGDPITAPDEGRAMPSSAAEAHIEPPVVEPASDAPFIPVTRGKRSTGASTMAPAATPAQEPRVESGKSASAQGKPARSSGKGAGTSHRAASAPPPSSGAPVAPVQSPAAVTPAAQAASADAATNQWGGVSSGSVQPMGWAAALRSGGATPLSPPPTAQAPPPTGNEIGSSPMHAGAESGRRPGAQSEQPRSHAPGASHCGVPHAGSSGVAHQEGADLHAARVPGTGGGVAAAMAARAHGEGSTREGGEGWEELDAWWAEKCPRAAAVAVHAEHVVGRGLDQLSMSQLEALQEFYTEQVQTLSEMRFQRASELSHAKRVESARLKQELHAVTTDHQTSHP